MTGRRLACTAALMVLSWPPVMLAQQPGARVARIGFLVELRVDENVERDMLGPLRQELHKLGYVQGRSMLLEVRSAEGVHARLRGVTEELVGREPHVLVAAFPAPALAAQAATRSIPVVGVGVDDPVAMGLAQTMARPGGNVTGISGYALELVAKRLQLLREFVPQAERIAILANPDAGRGTLSGAIPAWESTLGARIVVYRARSPQEFEGVFDAMARDGMQGLVVLADNNTYTHRLELNELCLRRRMPSVWGSRHFLMGGGLASYQSDFPSMFRRAAAMVDRILKGEQPQDMAFEQSTRLELAIDLRAARALGIAVPRDRLAVADVVLK